MAEIIIGQSTHSSSAGKSRLSLLCNFFYAARQQQRDVEWNLSKEKETFNILLQPLYTRRESGPIDDDANC